MFSLDGFLAQTLLVIGVVGFVWTIIGLPTGLILAIVGSSQKDKKKSRQYLKSSLIAGLGGGILVVIAVVGLILIMSTWHFIKGPFLHSEYLPFLNSGY